MISDLHARLDALRAKLEEAWRVLDISATKEAADALEAAAGAPGFWDEPETATAQTRKLADLKKEYGRWQSLREAVMEADELLEIAEREKDEAFAQEAESSVADLEKRYADVEFAMLLGGPHDAANAVVSIHAGAGGTDAQDWAEMLQRMYFRYAERKDWSVRLLDESRGGEAGIKSATFLVEGRYAYGHFKGEAGVHRLVRMSPFNADQLRQTSFALVEILPELAHDADIEVRPEDLRIDTFMSGGKGGQSVNTTYSAVRIVHLPTGITVSCQNERSQAQNKEVAMRILKAKLLQRQEEERQKEKQQLRGEYHGAGWGNQIRSYVMQPYRLVKDLRTGVESSDPQGVLDGDLDAFVEAELRQGVKPGDRRVELNEDVGS